MGDGFVLMVPVELNQASHHKLAATPLWIEQGVHGITGVGTAIPL
jgi:hypothetical protein